MKDKPLLIFLMIATFVLAVLVGKVLLTTVDLKSTNPSPSTSTVQNGETENTITEEPVPTVIEKIPFDYKVVRKDGTTYILEGKKGKMTLRNVRGKINVFIRKEGGDIPSTFDEIKVGDKLVLKRVLKGRIVDHVDVFILR